MIKEKLIEIIMERLHQVPKKTLKTRFLKMIERQGISPKDLQQEHGVSLMILTNKKTCRLVYCHHIKDLFCKKYKLKINS
jgi:hypothetical protein